MRTDIEDDVVDLNIEVVDNTTEDIDANTLGVQFGFSCEPTDGKRKNKIVSKVISCLIRVGLIIITSLCCNNYIETHATEVVNDLAVQQMTINNTSSSDLYLYTLMLNYLWVVPVILALLLFLPEIIKTIKKLIFYVRKEIKKHEENT